MYVFVSLAVMGGASVHGVLFQSTGDPSYNTNAPSGVLANSGWQYQGTWGAYLGTPIAPRFFITAKHVDGLLSQVFTLNGFKYHPVAMFTTIDSDLNVWETAETFPSYAPLYTSSDESNKHIVVFGRGTERGSPVIVSGVTNGWQWGTTNYVQRWGENDVSSITNGGVGVGDLLRCTFDRGAGSNECHLSVGDSSGGLFIQDGGVWKLAGINREVDGPFSNAVDGTAFDAALVDVRDLYEEVSLGNWQLMSGPQPIPSAFYCTRISANIAWINSVIDFAPAGDLQITGIQAIGNDIQVSFASGSNRVYFAQSTTNMVSGAWTTFTNNVAGTGGIVSVIDSNAATVPGRSYRIGISQ